MKQHYDSWFRGASEFWVKCGSVQGFTASTEAELRLYQPSVTDFMISVKRDQLGVTLPFDAVIIATDIGSEHIKRAKPFIEAGLPLFIDKPLCDHRADLEYFTKLFESGYPLLSSSSLRYCKEIRPYYHGATRELGELRLIQYGMPKKWETYGIHTLEAVYPIVGPGFYSVRNTGTARRNIVHIKHKSGVDLLLTGIYDQAGPIPLIITGNSQNAVIYTHDSYNSFRDQLVAFIPFLRTGERPFPWQETVDLMKLLIGGIESREQGGKEILI